MEAKITKSLTLAQHERALKKWVKESKEFLSRTHPTVNFEDNCWIIPGMSRRRFNILIKLCKEKEIDPVALTIWRCVLAHYTEIKKKTINAADQAYRLLLNSGVDNPLNFLPEHFDAVQNTATTVGDSKFRAYIIELQKIANLLLEKGLMDYAWHRDEKRFRSRNRKKDKFKNLENWHINADGYTNVDHRVAAFTDLAHITLTSFEHRTALEQSQFTQRDEEATLIYMLKMCAPARINEVLNMTINDRAEVGHYLEPPEDIARHLSEDGKAKDINKSSGLLYQMSAHRAQRKLFDAPTVLMQKGSKGARFSAKPVLKHMINLCNYSMDRLIESAPRSRMLAEHYEKYPDLLYFPPGFEYLNDKSKLTLLEIHRITHFCVPVPERSNKQAYKKALRSVHWVFTKYYPHPTEKGKTLKKSLLPPLRREKELDPLVPYLDGSKNVRKVMVLTYCAKEIKKILLEKVHQSISEARNITRGSVQYHGKLSEMLCLTDTAYKAPYLIGAWEAGHLQTVFAESTGKSKRRMENVYDRLGIRMIQFDEDEPAWIDSHDFRRFLTDNALECQNAVEGIRKLSDVLINGWANRADINQLTHYRRPFSEVRAERVALAPSDTQVRLLEDMGGCSELLSDYDAIVREKANERGLATFTYSIQGTEVTISLSDSLDRVHAGIDSLGKVRTMIPLRHGSCLHDNAINPCQHIVKHCFGCNQRVYTRGDQHRHAQVQKVYRNGFEFLYRQMAQYLDDLDAGRLSEDDGKTLFPMLINRDLNPKTLAHDVVARFEFLRERLRQWPVIYDVVEETFVAKANLEFEADERYRSGDRQIYNGENKATIRSELINEFDEVDKENELLKKELKKKFGKEVNFLDQTLSVEDTRGLLNRPYLDSEEDEL